ncbi:aldehyde oxidase GLOX1-like [Salvia hispanica]|uniref:aldehyde oxidase GLOX1-like n=1 Tax=Salvia hispanica TaxID=49212 RepID=UPI002009839D|nr:aldehyde oxidase GLOX1-like [Salvia hispanica]
MHMQLLHTDRVVMFDRTNFGSSNISLPNGECVHDPDDPPSRLDCTAHSVEYDVASNSVRPLTLSTNIWCSSGAVLPDGTLVQTGGNGRGDHAVRLFKPCTGKNDDNNNSSCNWQETTKALSQRRWYATSQILPDRRQIIVGGRDKFNYEFYPKKTAGEGSYNLPFLYQTFQSGKENNLYPFVLLNTDGNLFIFANNRAILFNHTNSRVIRTYPTLPGGDPRNYPSTGSAVLLPLNSSSTAEVLVCGGAPTGSYESAYNNRDFVEALNTCGRIRINDPDPHWAMETMPLSRVMGDMLLLPDGNVLIINGAASGTAAWELGRGPVLSPVLYYPENQPGSRFEVQNPTSTPRMYHSSAILLRDGRVIVGGSNPHEFYNFTDVLFPTDLTLESFSPPYLDPQLGYLRPRILSPVSGSYAGYGQDVMIRFSVGSGRVVESEIMVTMIAPAFATHSFSMNQRLLILDGWDVKAVGRFKYQVRVTMPGSGNFAPGGYYLLFVVHRDIPSEGIWIHIS